MRCLSKTIVEPLVLPNVASEWEPLDGKGIYTFKLLTPMFGGGPNTGNINDQVGFDAKDDKAGFELRAATIRGYLREWWRRLYRNDNSKEPLLVREGRIWGAIGPKAENVTSSRVKIQVRVTSAERDYEWKNDRNKVSDKYSAYALFAFPMMKDDDGNDISPDYCLSAMEFVVEVSVKYRGLTPDQKELVRDQVRESLRAWANFGGVGARVRRGVGSIWCQELACRDATELNELANRASASFLYKNGDKDALTTWKRVIGTMESFRKPVGREESPWPEAQHVLGHCPKHLKERGVPRAAFGLPLAMQDIQRKYTEILYPYRNRNKLNHMSSPIILRPVCTQSGALLQVALFLPKADFTSITVVSDKGKSFSQGEIFSKKFGTCVALMQGYDSAVEAYYGYLINKQGFTKGGKK